VEDNPINQAVVLGFLEDSGLRIEVATDGQEGVRRCQESAFDLILMDVQMPVMDGLEASRRIRALDSEVPIVALTANAFAEDVAASRAAGMNTHLSKPIDLAHLQAILNHFLAPNSGLGDPDTQAIAPPQAPGGDIASLHLDPAAGLTLMGGNNKLYRRILGNFAWTYADLELDLSQPDARRTLHSLKGLSANIGALALREKAAALEQSLDGTQLPAFRQELAAVIDAIRRHLQAETGDKT